MRSRRFVTAEHAAVIFAFILAMESSASVSLLLAFTSTHHHRSTPFPGKKYASTMRTSRPSKVTSTTANQIKLTSSPPSTSPSYLSALSSLDQEIQSWASKSGFGSVDRSIPAGSSGWATFRKVTVTNPPPQPSMNHDNKPEKAAVSFFVKSSTRSCQEMFMGEAMGLKALHSCATTSSIEQHEAISLRIPKVYHYGDFDDGGGSLLIMEYLSLAGRSDDRSLGLAMARLHLAPANEETGNPTRSFGFSVDNTIGGTLQPNPWTKPNSGTNEWIEFFRDHRIGHQLKLADDTYCSNLWTNDIAPRLHLLFEDLMETNNGKGIQPSLLHGDLWSGNIGSADGKPSIFDPAVYWGHHEAEWGMSWCAGFGPQFWEGYRSLIPQDEGFLDRKPLYDAYHQLNHYNLFGGGYLGSARSHLENLKKKLDAKEK